MRTATGAAAVVAGMGTLLAPPVTGAAFAAANSVVLSGEFGSQATGRCLDSNAAGHVYTNPCDGNNKYQWWDVSTALPGRYVLRNQATGRCLDSNTKGSVYTSPCDNNNTYENWTLNRDSATTIESSQTHRCLDSNKAGSAYTSPCDSNNHYEIWL
jgi:hypothetical protein